MAWGRSPEQFNTDVLNLLHTGLSDAAFNELAVLNTASILTLEHKEGLSLSPLQALETGFGRSNIERVSSLAENNRVVVVGGCSLGGKSTIAKGFSVTKNDALFLGAGEGYDALEILNSFPHLLEQNGVGTLVIDDFKVHNEIVSGPLGDQVSGFYEQGYNLVLTANPHVYYGVLSWVDKLGVTPAGYIINNGDHRKGGVADRHIAEMLGVEPNDFTEVLAKISGGSVWISNLLVSKVEEILSIKTPYNKDFLAVNLARYISQEFKGFGRWSNEWSIAGFMGKVPEINT